MVIRQWVPCNCLAFQMTAFQVSSSTFYAVPASSTVFLVSSTWLPSDICQIYISCHDPPVTLASYLLNKIENLPVRATWYFCGSYRPPASFLSDYFTPWRLMLRIDDVVVLWPIDASQYWSRLETHRWWSWEQTFQDFYWTRIWSDASGFLYPTEIYLVRFQVLTAASMKMRAFWNMAPRNLVEIDRR
jgi:hypothetical protein